MKYFILVLIIFLSTSCDNKHVVHSSPDRVYKEFSDAFFQADIIAIKSDLKAISKRNFPEIDSLFLYCQHPFLELVAVIKKDPAMTTYIAIVHDGVKGKCFGRLAINMKKVQGTFFVSKIEYKQF